MALPQVYDEKEWRQKDPELGRQLVVAGICCYAKGGLHEHNITGVRPKQYSC